MKADKQSGRMEAASRVVLLVGNLNVGKTTIFERLCRGKPRSFNYPGTSVWLSSSRISGTEYTLIDSPGIHSMFTLSEDETITRDTILAFNVDLLVVVGDAKNLARSLALFLQFAEYRIPLVLNLNMLDEARQRGIAIDTDRLSEILGVPVNTSVAVEGIGLRNLRRLLDEARPCCVESRFPLHIETYLTAFQQAVGDECVPARALALQALAEDKGALRHLQRILDRGSLQKIEHLVQDARSRFFQPPEVLLSELYTQQAHRIGDEVQTVTPPAHIPFAEKLGAWSRNVATGIPIAVLVLFAMYLVVGDFGAQVLVGWVEGGLFGKWVVPAVRALCLKVPFPVFERAITGEFGLVSVGLTLALGVVVPVLFMFFLAFGVIEDSGYLPRLSILMERVFRRVGLTGKGVLPIVMGFSCVTMAIMTTRILETRKERIIATILLLLGLPCAPLLSVMLVILGQLKWQAYVAVFGVIVLQMFVVGMVSDRILPGDRSLFFLEIPPLRIPKMKSIFSKTVQRIVHFTGEAIPVFLLATFVLFVLDEMGFLRLLEQVGRPFLEKALGLPAESVRVVISTLIRREAGAALLKELFDQGMFNDVQVVLLMLLCTFLVPCVNAILVTVKEHGVRTATAIILSIVAYALLLGIALNYLFQVLHVHFR